MIKDKLGHINYHENNDELIGKVSSRSNIRFSVYSVISVVELFIEEVIEKGEKVMVGSEKGVWENHCGLLLAFVVILGAFCVFYPKSGLAVDDYPGFGFLVGWTQYTEISIDQKDVDISQQIAQIIFRDPQSFWLSFGLGQEKIDTDSPFSQGQEIDDDLCFHAAGAYYIAPNLELGIPADLSLGASYSRSRHDVAEDKLTHQRITVTANLEWDYPPATPYIRVGALQSDLEYSALDEDNTSVFFVGGIQFAFAQRLFLGAEFNISEDIGFGGTLAYSF